MKTILFLILLFTIPNSEQERKYNPLVDKLNEIKGNWNLIETSEGVILESADSAQYCTLMSNLKRGMTCFKTKIRIYFILTEKMDSITLIDKKKKNEQIIEDLKHDFKYSKSIPLDAHYKGPKFDKKFRKLEVLPIANFDNSYDLIMFTNQPSFYYDEIRPSSALEFVDSTFKYFGSNINYNYYGNLRRRYKMFVDRDK